MPNFQLDTTQQYLYLFHEQRPPRQRIYHKYVRGGSGKGESVKVPDFQANIDTDEIGQDYGINLKFYSTWGRVSQLNHSNISLWSKNI